MNQITSPMKRRLCCAVFVLSVALAGWSATVPIYINSSPLIAPPAIPPQIDARAWVNRSTFDVTTLGSFNLPIPFESQNTLFFTNAPLTLMNGDPGFRFFQNVNGQRLWMDTWENQGSITTDHAAFLATFGFFFNDSRASILQVESTNISSTGPLSSGAHGLIRLEGKKIDLTRNGLRTGNPLVFAGIFGGGFVTIGSSNYVNDLGVRDLYWGAGTGNAVANSRASAMPLDGANFTLPSPSSPSHEIIETFSTSGFYFTNTTIIPSGFFFFGTNFVFSTNFLGGYTAVVNTNALTATSTVVQVVFYPTNNSDTNFTTDVKFSSFLGGPGFGSPATVVVGFHSVDFDIASQTVTSNSVFLTDALATTTNVFLARNLGGSTQRPSTYEVTRTEPFDYFNGLAPNGVFSATTFNNPNYLLRTATNRYAAYAAQIDLLSSSPSGSIPYDPTNMPGRIEILGEQVNLDQTRLRAESAVIIKAGDLTSNRLASVDAPFVNFNGRSTQPQLIISNLAPTTVRRLSGTIRAWSGVWQNFETVSTGTTVSTNSVLFHVLIVDSLLQSLAPVTVNEFAVHGTDLIINDLLQIGKSFLAEGTGLHFIGGLTLPVGVNLASNNLISLRNFTNDGVISISGSENFGEDRPIPYLNYVNRGSNFAGAHFIRTLNFDNPGCLAASGGVLHVDAATVSLVGNPQILATNVFTNSFGTNIFFFTNVFALSPAPKLQGVSEVRILAGDLTTSNSIISAGTLALSVTNRVSDSNTNGLNRWSVNGGFNVTRKPATGDLLATYLRSTSPPLGQVDHSWAGADRGATTAGYTNNLALAKLTLDGGANSLMRFFGVGSSSALYVDYLELLNGATNVNSFLAIAQNLTIYFANANLPAAKLDGAAGGRLRWVPDFVGPLSSTNLTYYFTNGPVVTNQTYTFNIALVTSKDLDSDGDGIVNADDATPIYVPENAAFSVSLASYPLRAAMLSWSALAYSSNFVEFKPAANAAHWEVLTNFHQGPYTAPVNVMDLMLTNVGSRVYRLRVDRGPYY